MEQSLDALGRALARLGGRRDIEVLRLGVVTTFAVGWLLPRLEALRAALPHVDLRVFTNNNRVEIPREGLDLAIRSVEPDAEPRVEGPCRLDAGTDGHVMTSCHADRKNCSFAGLPARPLRSCDIGKAQAK
jgi:DNA-binding transcriptional LysR family regulator